MIIKQVYGCDICHKEIFQCFIGRIAYQVIYDPCGRNEYSRKTICLCDKHWREVFKLGGIKDKPLTKKKIKKILDDLFYSTSLGEIIISNVDNIKKPDLYKRILKRTKNENRKNINR